MRYRIAFISLACIFLTFVSIGQSSSQKVKYQAVARDADDKIIPNKEIGVRFTIKESMSGEDIYIESHQTTTTSQGLFYLELGGGDPHFGLFSEIDWSGNDYSLEVALDLEGGSEYQTLGMSPILAVPISMYAQNADRANTANSVLNPPNLTSQIVETQDGNQTQ